MSSFNIDSERLILHGMSYLRYSSFCFASMHKMEIYFSAFLIVIGLLTEHLYFTAMIAE